MVHSTERRRRRPTSSTAPPSRGRDPPLAERRLADGHDVLLLGHFHDARSWRVAGGEVRMLDAWFRSRRVEWLG